MDAVEALCRELVGFLVVDEELEQRKREKQELASFLKDPLGTAQYKQTPKGPKQRTHRAMRRRQ
ncbi:hypothetical protein D3C85_1705470 [compost metagenome]